MATLHSMSATGPKTGTVIRINRKAAPQIAANRNNRIALAKLTLGFPYRVELILIGSAGGNHRLLHGEIGGEFVLSIHDFRAKYRQLWLRLGIDLHDPYLVWLLISSDIRGQQSADRRIFRVKTIPVVTHLAIAILNSDGWKKFR